LGALLRHIRVSPIAEFGARSRRAFDAMTAVDIALGLLAGLVSCLTPEALLLFPLAVAAAGADRPGRLATIAIGLGLSLVVTGAAALGFDAIWLRRVVCILLLLQGIALMSESTVERFPFLTGGLGGVHEIPGASVRSGFRLLLLALFVGANWFPQPGPTLVRASMRAADMRNSGLAFGVLFVFGVGAAIPWIVLGRIMRLLFGPVARQAFRGMAGKRVLGVTLLVVAVLGGSGLDLAMAHWLDARLPPWTRKLAIRF
jgi:cytochrome c-type biogenesis protein